MEDVNDDVNADANEDVNTHNSISRCYKQRVWISIRAAQISSERYIKL